MTASFFNWEMVDAHVGKITRKQMQGWHVTFFITCHFQRSQTKLSIASLGFTNCQQQTCATSHLVISRLFVPQTAVRLAQQLLIINTFCTLLQCWAPLSHLVFSMCQFKNWVMQLIEKNQMWSNFTRKKIGKKLTVVITWIQDHFWDSHFVRFFLLGRISVLLWEQKHLLAFFFKLQEFAPCLQSEDLKPELSKNHVFFPICLKLRLCVFEQTKWINVHCGVIWCCIWHKNHLWQKRSNLVTNVHLLS